MFCKKGVLENFAIFAGKHLCQSVFFNKVAGLRRDFQEHLFTEHVGTTTANWSALIKLDEGFRKVIETFTAVLLHFFSTI